jgi:hypothetical protein
MNKSLSVCKKYLSITNSYNSNIHFNVDEKYEMEILNIGPGMFCAFFYDQTFDQKYKIVESIFKEYFYSQSEYRKLKLKKNNKKMRCPFEIGEKIVCVEPNYHKQPNGSFILSENMPYLLRITNGKIYEVVEITISSKLYDNIGIINDINCSVIPRWEIFISLKEYRRRKLEILNTL